MFGGELLTSFVPEVGVQERMREHGKDPLWKIKYAEISAFLLFSYSVLPRGNFGFWPITEKGTLKGTQCMWG